MMTQSPKSKYRFSLGIMIAFSATAPIPAWAEVFDFHTTYATAKNACCSGSIIQWSPGRIEGADFDCKLMESTPAGTGLVSYQGTCAIGGELVTGRVNFSLGNSSEHFSVEIPDGQWFLMYPCTPVEGLDGTN
jgi:hypothetical protein